MADKGRICHSGGCQCGAVRYALYAEPYGTRISAIAACVRRPSATFYRRS